MTSEGESEAAAKKVKKSKKEKKKKKKIEVGSWHDEGLNILPTADEIRLKRFYSFIS